MRCAQARQQTQCRLPCSSVSVAVPAALCSPSMFWVISPVVRPLFSNIVSSLRVRCDIECRNPYRQGGADYNGEIDVR